MNKRKAQKITLDTVIDDEKILLKYNDTNLFSTNNLSIFNGLKGSMKSTFRDLILTKLFCNDQEFSGDFDGKVLIIDTEMSARMIQRSLMRYKAQGVDLSRIEYNTIKGVPYMEKMKETERLIEEIRPQVLIVDGSRDFIINSNDPTESMQAVNQLMYWIYQYNLHVINIVHSIRSDGGGQKTKGTFGSELDNKAETIINISRSGSVATVKNTFSRDSEVFKTFKIGLDENANPYKL